MRATRRVGWIGEILVAIALLSLSAAAVGADPDCWCAQFVDLEDEAPTRDASVFFRIAASAALTGVTLWGVDALGLPNAQWYKISALVMGASNTASALADLALPTARSIEADAERIAESILSEELCADTLAEYAQATRMHRYVSGIADLGSGMAQILLLSPYGRYASGGIYDYVFLVTGGIDIAGGLIRLVFPTRFERSYVEAREACGP